MNRSKEIFKRINEREAQMNELRKFLNSDELDDTEERRNPSIDQVMGDKFDYDDIMHYLKIETQEHKPLDTDARRLRRVAILCRMLLNSDF